MVEKRKEIHFGPHTAIRIGHNYWNLIIHSNLSKNSVPFEILERKVAQQAKMLVRYMRNERLISETEQTFNVIVKNENCA